MHWLMPETEKKWTFIDPYLLHIPGEEVHAEYTESKSLFFIFSFILPSSTLLVNTQMLVGSPVALHCEWNVYICFVEKATPGSVHHRGKESWWVSLYWSVTPQIHNEWLCLHSGFPFGTLYRLPAKSECLQYVDCKWAVDKILLVLFRMGWRCEGQD